MNQLTKLQINTLAVKLASSYIQGAKSDLIKMFYGISPRKGEDLTAEETKTMQAEVIKLWMVAHEFMLLMKNDQTAQNIANALRPKSNEAIKVEIRIGRVTICFNEWRNQFLAAWDHKKAGGKSGAPGKPVADSPRDAEADHKKRNSGAGDSLGFLAVPFGWAVPPGGETGFDYASILAAAVLLILAAMLTRISFTIKEDPRPPLPADASIDDLRSFVDKEQSHLINAAIATLKRHGYTTIADLRDATEEKLRLIGGEFGRSGVDFMVYCGNP